MRGLVTDLCEALSEGLEKGPWGSERARDPTTARRRQRNALRSHQVARALDIAGGWFAELLADDGRTRDDPSRQYGTGGKMQGKRFMICATWNAPRETFDNPESFMYAGKGSADLFLNITSNHKFVGFDILPDFGVWNIFKKPQIAQAIEAYKQHLDRYCDAKGWAAILPAAESRVDSLVAGMRWLGSFPEVAGAPNLDNPKTVDFRANILSSYFDGSSHRRCKIKNVRDSDKTLIFVAGWLNRWDEANAEFLSTGREIFSGGCRNIVPSFSWISEAKTCTSLS